MENIAAAFSPIFDISVFHGENPFLGPGFEKKNGLYYLFCLCLFVGDVFWSKYYSKIPEKSQKLRKSFLFKKSFNQKCHFTEIVRKRLSSKGQITSRIKQFKLNVTEFSFYLFLLAWKTTFPELFSEIMAFPPIIKKHSIHK